MNHLSSNTFCASSWFSVRNDNVERLTPCCAIDCSKSKFKGTTTYTISDTIDKWHNSKYMQYLRKELDSGVFPDECFQCRNDEEYGLQSIRKSSNKTIANNASKSSIYDSWLSAYFTKKDNFESGLIVSIDSMVSNFCNFECVMCNPLDSSKIKSKWEKNKTHQSLQYTLNSNPLYVSNTTSLIRNSNAIVHFHDIIHKNPISFLHIRGGEPLIDKQLLTMIEELPENKKKKIRLLFNSNCSVDLTTVLAQLTGFKDIIIIASLDAVGVYAEYVRKHCKWAETESSILSAIKNTNAIIKVHCTVHAINVMWLWQLEDWCIKHELEMTFDFVHDPEYMSLSSVPEDVLRIASSKLKNTGLANRINKYKFSKNLHNELLNFMKFYDETSNTKLDELLDKKGNLGIPFKVISG
jgi:molybdenum cofactor biosynthesis enzyme MoaA